MKSWPHAPYHAFNEAGTYMVTGSTINKEMFFKKDHELDLMNDLLLELAEHYHWRLEAWAIFPNHYHFIAHTSKTPTLLKKLVTHLHANSARSLNKSHDAAGRTIWYQYWDTQLTFQESYLARLNYVMENPVKHGLVYNAREYRWCSASWFERMANKSHFHIVQNIKTDSISIIDDFY